MPLPKIKINDANFTQLAFKALVQKRGFILTDTGRDFSDSIEHLCQAFDAFRKEPPEFKNQFKGIKDGVAGYYPYDAFHLGGRTTERFFINRDKDNHIIGSLPDGMQHPSDIIIQLTKVIAQKVSACIEAGLKLERQAFTKYLSPASFIAMSHYLPTTQEKLRIILANEHLTLDEDGKIRTFEKHKDLSLFSMLIYRKNNTNGLRLEIPDDAGKLVLTEIETLNVLPDDEINVIVIVGGMLEELTNGQLKGLTHQVVTRPLKINEEFYRDCISIFMSHDPHIDLHKLVPGHFEERINLQALFDKQHDVIKAYMNKYHLKELPTQALLFPREEDIVKLESQQGIIYKRIA